LATIYARLSAGADVAALQAELEKAYRGAPFVKALPMRSLPATRHVRGSNLCLIAVHPSRIDGEVIILSVIDNLVKGASGQAIQNMNLMCGLPEDMGLRIAPVFP
jgi:N-acetyl-gamma-glutamyl-phosphate reductase